MGRTGDQAHRGARWLREASSGGSTGDATAVWIALAAALALLLLGRVGACASSRKAALGSDARADEPAGDRGSLLRLALRRGESVRVCLTGTGVTPNTRKVYETMIERAAEAWLAILDEASLAPTLRGVRFVRCGKDGARTNTQRDAYDVYIDWSAQPTAGGDCTPFAMGCRRAHSAHHRALYLYANSPQHVVTREFGTLFGVAETYPPRGCKQGRARSIFCRDALAIGEDDRSELYEAFCAAYPEHCALRWRSAANWCTGQSEQLLLGDFNGDGRTDMLCHDPIRAVQRIAYATAAADFTRTGELSATASVCAGPSSTLLVADVNGDRRADLVCHDRETGRVRTLQASQSGAFSGRAVTGRIAFCRGEATSLRAAYFDADRRADLVCVHASESYVSIALASADGTFDDEPWREAGAFCTTQALLTGDFNGDGHPDLLCHPGDSPYGRVRFGARETMLERDLASVTLGCQSPYELHLGDFDGDGRTDVSCRARPPLPPDWTIRFPGPHKPFSADSQLQKLAFCTDVDEQMLVGDFDGDTRSDFLCHSRTSGAISIAYQRPKP